jgi:hypothetical protein
MPTVIGTGTVDNGTSVNIPVSTAVTVDGALQICFCQITIGSPTAYQDVSSAPSSCNDTRGHSYTLSTGSKALVGLCRQSTTLYTLQVGSIGRLCSAGDLGLADSITLNFASGYPSLFHVVAIAVLIEGSDFEAVRQLDQSFINYGTGDTYPDFGSSPTTLNWQADQGFLAYPNSPPGSAALLAVSGIHPARTNYQPASGAKVHELHGSNCSLAVSYIGSVLHASPVDPGGTWGQSGDGISGAYQFMNAVETGPAVHLAHHYS